MQPKKLSPQTEIVGTRYNVADFWSWGFSSVLTNSLRGILAEFLVGSALDLTEYPRIEWDAYDLVFKGKKIEVKSAAYIQAWHREKYSRIAFNIGAKRAYDYNSNLYSSESVRHADIYVFCLLKEKDIDQINPLNVEQWEFYIVLTEKLNHLYPTQKSISLNAVQKVSPPLSYYQIKEQLERIFSERD